MYELECNVREQSSDKQAEWDRHFLNLMPSQLSGVRMAWFWHRSRIWRQKVEFDLLSISTPVWSGL